MVDSPRRPAGSGSGADAASGPPGAACAASGGGEAAAAAEPPREVELKLLLDPASLERVRSFDGFARRAVGRARRRRLHSVYYDTRDLALLRAGLALRVRRVGGRIVQTIKGRVSGAAGIFERIEVEDALGSFEPQPDAIGHPDVRERVRACTAGEPLEPVLETDFERTTLRLREGASEVDADLDLGEIRTPAGALPICELELELRTGEPADLHTLALELHEKVPVQLATRSKFDRGIALLRAERPTPVRAHRLAVAPAAPLEEAVEQILRACLDQVLANEAAAGAGEDPEGVHQMRVGVRRLRSALWLFRRELPEAARRHFADELRWLSGELGAARDVDVFLDEVLGPILERAGEDSSLAWLREEGEALRQERYEALRRAIGSPRYTALMLGLAGFVARRGWRQQPLGPASARLFQRTEVVARELLERCHRRVRRRGRPFAAADAAQLHALRIALKKLRYAVEFLGSAIDAKRARRYARSVARVQDPLGRLADLVEARELLDVLVARRAHEPGPSGEALGRGAGFVLGWAARDAGGVVAEAHRAWRRLRRRKRFWRGAARH